MAILLITSRDTGRWIIPKGWPTNGKTSSQAAAIEAYEEAGTAEDRQRNQSGVYLSEIPCRAFDQVLAVYDLFNCHTDQLNEVGARRVFRIDEITDEQDRVIDCQRETRDRAFEDRLIGDSGRAYALKQTQTFVFCHSWQQSSGSDI
ncbi:hypothetical protein [Rhizobium sp.]|uniref:hypothetical protein n=1 Tax=Rhizobium sp. TaxID=391 RepID=UPI0028ADF2C6